MAVSTIAPRVLSHHIVDFLESRRMETAPTSIEVILRPTLGQSDEPSDLRDLEPHDTTSLHACPSVYSTWYWQSSIQLGTEPGVAVSAYPPFSIPGGTLKLVSDYRGYVETSFNVPPGTLKLEKDQLLPPVSDYPPGVRWN